MVLFYHHVSTILMVICCCPSWWNCQIIHFESFKPIISASQGCEDSDIRVQVSSILMAGSDYWHASHTASSNGIRNAIGNNNIPGCTGWG